MKLDWQNIDTVFLDMDGTLLDLNFDNHFWTRYVPGQYGKKHGITTDEAFERIFPHMLAKRGSLEWYDVHYWSEYLQMDVLTMKHAAADRIKPRPGAIEFLQAVRSVEKPLVLATNAHQDTLQVKFNRSGIGPYFDHIVTSHQLGVAKETPQFWDRLHQLLPFDRGTSLFVDDNQSVLDAAGEYGIGCLYTIDTPDLQQPAQAANGYPVIDCFHTFAASIRP